MTPYDLRQRAFGLSLEVLRSFSQRRAVIIFNIFFYSFYFFSYMISFFGGGGGGGAGGGEFAHSTIKNKKLERDKS